MTRAELQALIERVPAESDAQYRLITKQGNSSAEFHVTTGELVTFTGQLQQTLPDLTD